MSRISDIEIQFVSSIKRLFN